MVLNSLHCAEVPIRNCSLIHAAKGFLGGSWLIRPLEDTLNSRTVMRCGLIVVELRQRCRAYIVCKEWLLNSVGSYDVKPLDPYLVISRNDDRVTSDMATAAETEERLAHADFDRLIRKLKLERSKTSLHWLRIESRIKFKITCITYKTVSTTQPAYLHSVLKQYAPSHRLRSCSLLAVPHALVFIVLL